MSPDHGDGLGPVGAQPVPGQVVDGRLGAVGDVCFRFFHEEGKHVRSTFDQRVIGVTAKELLAVPRRIGVAGGERKFSAIRAALLGGWVNILITDQAMATRLREA